MSEEKQKALEAAGWRVGDAETFVGGCGACVVIGHNAPDGILPNAPIYRRQPRPEGCEDCSGCPDCYTNEKPCDCADMSQNFDATVKLIEVDPVVAEAMRRRDEELAKLIGQSRQLGPMTSEEQREQRISWVYGNCKLSNPDVTREMVENAVDFGPTLTHMDGHLAALSEREAPMIIRPVSAYADDEPPLDSPTEEDAAARRKWADRHVAVLAASPSLSARATAPQESLHFRGDPDAVQWWGTGGNLDFSQSATGRKLNLKLDDPPPPYHNPLAALRRERKIKPGKAAKLLGISRQRLYVVEHATKPLRCMGRLLAKAATVWPVVDETTAPHKESK